MAYQIHLTAEDIQTIEFVGGRYAWSDALLNFAPSIEEGERYAYLELAEHEAWELVEAFEQDTEGGHSMFPMLADCPFRERLIEFYNTVV
jgi:hypothetical protein